MFDTEQTASRLFATIRLSFHFNARHSCKGLLFFSITISIAEIPAVTEQSFKSFNLGISHEN